MKTKTIITITTVITTATLLPLASFAALDFNLEDLFLEQTAPNINIRSIDLAWSADTYTPANYEGRNLPTIGSEVVVEAIVSASDGNPNALKYSWFLEDIFQRSKSGYGKNSFSFYVQQRSGNFHNIKVQVFNDDRTIFEQRTLQIPVVKPEIVIYSSANNTYFSNQASKNSISVFGDKLSLIAKPYFFSIRKLTDLVFEWTLSGQEPVQSSDYTANVLNLSIENARGTENSIWLNVQNSDEPRQNVSQSINLEIP
jgi:hypothetical protein